MELSPGRDLTHYRLIERIGEGGMGVVWKATDTSLGRDVAIKVLPEAFAGDPDRMARFEREARVLASLNHPHIVVIYGVGALEGVRFLAMELVEGDDLAVRLARGPLTVRETVELGRELAEALEVAHEKGIIHRDLKPANLKLNAEGEVKVLDFGLAKALDPETAATSASSVSMSPTLTSPMTAANVILGTAAYMSPEQARGKTVDRRADIWAFGCVLYECLTAQRPFPGETVSDTIAKILEREPDWSALPAGTPARLRELLRRCLEKDAKKRLRDIGDARIELDELLAAGVTASGTMAAGAATGAATRGSSRLAWGVAAAAVLALVASVLVMAPGRRASIGVPTRTTIDVPAGRGLWDLPASSALSPDGTTIVFTVSDSSGSSHLMLRPVASLDARPLPGTEFSGPESGLPFWSPDSRFVGYFADGKLFKVPIAGGTPQALCDSESGRGGTWNQDGVILFAPMSSGPLYRVSQAGGDRVVETALDSSRRETAHRFPRFLPDGRHYTFASVPGSDGKTDTWIGELGSRKRTLAIRANTGAIFAAPGYMLFVRDQSLVAQPFSLARSRAEGEPVRIGDAPSNQNMLGSPAASASEHGMLVFPTSVTLNCRLQWFARDEKPGGILPVPAGDYREIAISPDGSRIALLRQNSPTSNDIWIADAVRGNIARLTTDGFLKGSLKWSGDGLRIAFAQQRGTDYDFYQRPVSGAGDAQPLFVSGSPFKDLSQLTPDDSLLVYSDLGSVTGRDLYVYPLHGERKPVPYLVTPFNEVGGQLSPDKRWMLYQSDESGRSETYIQSFPTPGTKLRISQDGSYYSTWVRGGGEILFAGTGDLMSVTVQRGPTLTVSEPRVVRRFVAGAAAVGTAPDGQRFLLALPEAGAPRPSLTLVTNWPALLPK